MYSPPPQTKISSSKAGKFKTIAAIAKAAKTKSARVETSRK
jgi:hypothetical protein